MARSVADVETLAPSWRLSLEAENKSPAPITSYTYATTRLVAFLRDKGMSNDVNAIAREHIEVFLVDVLERRSPATGGPATERSGNSSPGARPRARSP